MVYEGRREGQMGGRRASSGVDGEEWKEKSRKEEGGGEVTLIQSKEKVTYSFFPSIT